MSTVRGGLSGLFGMFTAEAEGSPQRQKTKGSNEGSEQELVLEPILVVRPPRERPMA